MHFDAVIFDMDGVVTRTAQVHSLAWKRMFDEYLRGRTAGRGEPFREFTHAEDYRSYVDGRPRYQGVATFLKSRGINIPFGEPGDTADQETVCGLGNRKDRFFNKVLAEEGVGVFASTLELIQGLRECGIKVGVATSSQNCAPVLERAKILHLFATRVDGVVSAQLGLRGKPEPDIFITACRNLGVAPARAVVVEDAVSGVQAGAKGGFALVLGVARENNARELKAHGADVVVEDLAEASVEKIDKWVALRHRAARAD
ncbi:MAG TPA: beta-phosphoglucomutase family hydrolase [Candidatus Acidoferrum sp.]|nr:beta-phosphoglucomutase family hydrolase [Candidatus Acidoferrum sp.]